MKIAVTGGRGRLGRALAQLAASQGHTVASIDLASAGAVAESDGVIESTADVTRFEDLLRCVEGAHALVHLAAYLSPGVQPDHVVHNSNVTGSYNALSVATTLGITKVCLASSVNAIGGVYSRHPRYDYFPVDEHHPTYAEDPYSLSKWETERQADAVARRHQGMTISSLRLHALCDRQTMNGDPENGWKDLWGYTPVIDAAHACLASLSADFRGHETFFVVAPETISDTPSLQLRERLYPQVPVVGDLSGHRSFFDTSKARSLLGWSIRSTPAIQS
jgi:nucleoside-diphosphate-sugar epimerase